METVFLNTTQINQLSLQELRYEFDELQKKYKHAINVHIPSLHEVTSTHMEFLIANNLDMNFFAFVAEKKRNKQIG
jgi:hypothetical protein